MSKPTKEFIDAEIWRHHYNTSKMMISELYSDIHRLQAENINLKRKIDLINNISSSTKEENKQ